MSQMFQCTFLDHLDQYQIELGIRPIHQVYSYCNALNTISVSKLLLLDRYCQRSMVYEIQQCHFGVLCDLLTATQSNWCIDISLEMELHFQGLPALAGPTSTALL